MIIYVFVEKAMFIAKYLKLFNLIQHLNNAYDDHSVTSKKKRRKKDPRVCGDPLSMKYYYVFLCESGAQTADHRGRFYQMFSLVLSSGF